MSVDHSSVVVTWSKPLNLGGRRDVWYRLECRDCPPNTHYSPSASKFNVTKATLTNLDPSTVYTVLIFAENEVSSQIDGLPMYAVVEATTKSLSPTQIANFKVDSISENQIALSWDPPVVDDVAGGTVFFAEYDTMTLPGDWPGPKRVAAGVVTDFESGSKRYVQYYQIKQYMKNSPMNVTIKTANEPKVTMQGLVENVEYVFEVSLFVLFGNKFFWIFGW